MLRYRMSLLAEAVLSAAFIVSTSGCGDSSPTGGGDGSARIVDGTLDGNPFTPQSAVFDVAHGETGIVITSAREFCEFVQTSWSVDFPLPRSREGLLVELNVAVQKPGKSVLLPGEAQLIISGADCQLGAGSGDIDGSFTFDVVSPTALSGTFDVDVHGTMTTIKFDAVRCESLLMPAPQEGQCH